MPLRFGGFIPEDDAVRDAVHQRMPFTLLYPKAAASRRVLEKLGMQREALRAKDHIGRAGEMVDEVVYGLNLDRGDEAS